MTRAELIAAAAEMSGPWSYGKRIWWATCDAFGDEAVSEYIHSPVDCYGRDELVHGFLDALERDGLLS